MQTMKPFIIMPNCLIFFLALFISTPLAYSQFHDANWFCLDDAGNYTTDSTYQDNLLTVLPNLTNQSSLSSFGNSSTGEGIDKVYALYNCRGDLNLEQCHGCVKEAAQKIFERCPSEKETIIWYEECMLRFANRPIFSFEEENPYVWDYSPGSDSNPELPRIVAENIDELIEQAAYNKTTKGYITGQANVAPLDDVYFLVQCTPDILGSRCERCLRAAFRSMAGCCGTSRSSMMMFFPSCHIRYDRAAVVLNEADSAPSSPSPVTSFPPSNSSSPMTPNTGGSAPRMIRSYKDSTIASLVMLTSMLMFTVLTSI